MKNKLTTFARQYEDMYEQAELLGVMNSLGHLSVQVTERSLKCLFPEIDFIAEPYTDEYDCIRTMYEGIEFMALKEKK